MSVVGRQALHKENGGVADSPVAYPALVTRARRWFANAGSLRPRFRPALPLISVMLLALGLSSARRAPLPNADSCYLLGDADQRLTWVSLADRDSRTNETTIGRSYTAKTDSIALHPGTGVLFGVNVLMPRLLGYLGEFDLTTGAFHPRLNDLGDGQGPLGTLHFYDVSGLAFDPATGWLYASQIIVGPGVPDVLFRVDPGTGRTVLGAFGEADYVVLHPLPEFPELSDVDDIAIAPATGHLFGNVTIWRDGVRLVKLDKVTGALTDVGAFGIGEVEGLAFDPRGRLWATAGSAPRGDAANALYAVDPATGAASDRHPLDNSGNYEALACLTTVPDPRPKQSERGAHP